MHPDRDAAFDTSKPDGPPRKLLDVSRFTRSGGNTESAWPRALASTYQWFLTHQDIAADIDALR